MFDIASGLPLEPMLQRYREYARQRQMTLGDLLLENRIVFLAGVINDASAIEIVMKLLYLQYENKTQEIHFYISSPGGSVTSTLSIYDTIQFLECPVATYCIGMAASGGAILLAGGTKGKRYALPHAKVMVHQPWGQVGGQVSDIEIQAKEILKDRQRLNQILAKHTGRPLDQIEIETERDRYFSAQEAKEFGLVDDVLIRLTEEKKK
ncbi:MAG TPA: ATP-dependent Clp protease proteolytic subunit [Gemmataceae bacterium]|jgi:ATP-dependent Clp protease protease subunit|nr:ATP-dependent Clp protease proteolytic subunit [Gemmataceae bacterium]